MKLILNKTRHLELSNHINYKAIGLILWEIWFFEVYLGILCSVLGSTCYEEYNSPYTTWNWVQSILLESLHIEKHSIKILESNSVPIAPRKLLKLPHVLTRLEQGSLEWPNSRAYNLSSIYSNEMKLSGNENEFS